MKSRYIPDIRNIGAIKQGVTTLIIILLITICCAIIGLKSIVMWNLIYLPLFLFCVYNPVLGGFQQNFILYLVQSVAIFILLMIFAYFLGNLIATTSYNNTPELHTMTILMVLFYFMFQLICVVFRGVIKLLHEIDE